MAHGNKAFISVPGGLTNAVKLNKQKDTFSHSNPGQKGRKALIVNPLKLI